MLVSPARRRIGLDVEVLRLPSLGTFNLSDVICSLIALDSTLDVWKTTYLALERARTPPPPARRGGPVVRVRCRCRSRAYAHDVKSKTQAYLSGRLFYL